MERWEGDKPESQNEEDTSLVSNKEVELNSAERQGEFDGRLLKIWGPHWSDLKKWK